MKRSSLFALLAFMLAVSASLLYAGNPKVWKQPTWKVAKLQSSVISAVNASAGTLSIKHVGGKDKQDRDLKTNTFTEVMIDGKKSTAASLKPGMRVDYTLGGDGETLARIETLPDAPVAPTPVATATPSFPNASKTKQPAHQ